MPARHSPAKQQQTEGESKEESIAPPRFANGGCRQRIATRNHRTPPPDCFGHAGDATTFSCSPSASTPPLMKNRLTHSLPTFSVNAGALH